MIDSIKDILMQEAEAIKNIPVDDNFEKAITIVHLQRE
jgi:hypothetical protein